MQRLFNLLYFSSSRANLSFGPAAVSYIQFVCAVLGSVMIGWSGALLFVLFGAFRRGLSTLGIRQNALLNLAVVVLFAIPLGFTFRVFHSGDGAWRIFDPH